MTDLDLLGVGVGPFNLSLAALLDPVPAVQAEFYEQAVTFGWHPGLLLAGVTTQVPFLADLVTLVDPTSRHSFLEYLRTHDRLYQFYFRERFHVPRREYDHYCRWVAGRLPSCRFGVRVDALRWLPDAAVFEAELTDVRSGQAERRRARNVVLGVGTTPYLPPALAGAVGDEVFHAGEFLDRREVVAGAGAVTVVGSGQSGAEVFLELLREQPEHGYRLDWLTRSPGFLPMEYTSLGLEHFTPDYTEYFRSLPAPTRDRLLPSQDLLYKGIGPDTSAEIYQLLYDRSVGGARPAVRLRPHLQVEGIAANPAGPRRWRLACRHRQLDRPLTIDTDCLVLATGYRAARPALLDPVVDRIQWDEHGRFQVDAEYRVATDPSVSGGLFVQNAELHTHGVGTPDLGLGAHRAATISNAVAGRAVYRLPRRVAFTEFGV
ncbi:MAG TPA: lysine N(6)-hydroxylase/L-ornithine N(5)-oxygenase family protein [Mycobacteriales bacterium]|nr:lysine N(6)-hydroxylase/L-ornithine N(5)-oxygenase family protein [Mycobacteriales bacterium]